MSGRTGLTIGVAVGLSAVLFVARPALLTTPALVVVRDLPAGAVLSLEDFAVKDVAATIAATSVVEPGQGVELVGRALRHGLRAGDLIRPVDVAGRPEAMPAGFRLVTLSLDEQKAGHAQRGDQVDVIAVGQGVARTLVSRADVREVIAREAPRPTTVTLRVPSHEAEALMIASEASVLWLSLRSPDDDTVTTRGREVTIETLLRPTEPHRCNYRPLQIIRGDGTGG